MIDIYSRKLDVQNTDFENKGIVLKGYYCSQCGRYLDYFEECECNGSTEDNRKE